MAERATRLLLDRSGASRASFVYYRVVSCYKDIYIERAMRTRERICMYEQTSGVDIRSGNLRFQAYSGRTMRSLESFFSSASRVRSVARVSGYGTILVVSFLNSESRRFLNEFTPVKTNKMIHVDQATRRAQVLSLFVAGEFCRYGRFVRSLANGPTSCFARV